MNNLDLLIIICIIILIYIIYKRSIKYEHLTYTNNCYRSLEDEIQTLKELDCQYYNSVASDEKITDTYNNRDKLAYKLFSTV